MKKYRILIICIVILIVCCVFAQPPILPIINFFLDLDDTPSTYSGQDGKYVKVDETNEELIFGTPAGAGSMSTVEDGDVQVGGADIVTLDLDGTVFAVTEAPDTEINIDIADDGLDSQHYINGSIDLVHLAAGIYAKDIVTTSPITGGTNNVLVGADSDVTIAIADADDDGATKGAASFDNTDFNATGGNVTIVDDGHAHTGVSITPTDWDDIGDAGGDGSIDFAGTEQIIASTLDGVNKAVLTIDHTDADVTNVTSLLMLKSVDDNDPSLYYIKIHDNTGGAENSIFSVGADGDINTDGNLVAGGTITEGGNAVYNSGETPSGELGGTYANITIDDGVAVTNWNLTTPTITTSLTTSTPTTLAVAELDRLDGLAGVIVTDGTAVTDIEGTGLSIGGATLNWSAASTDLTDTADLLYEAELDSFAELDTQIADKTLVNTADGAVWSGVHDYGGTDSFEIVNDANPTTDATGEIALDTTITDHQPLLQYYDGGENMTVIAIDTAQLPALDNEIVKYDAGADKFILEADAGGGGGNDVYIEEGDAAKVDSSGADLYVDFDSTDFDVGVVGNEGNVTIPDDGHNHTTTSISGIVAADMGDADHGDVEWSGGGALVQAATIADTVYASCYVGLFQAATGNNEPFYTDGALIYDATTGTLDATALTEGGNAIYNAADTPGGILGGTWQTPTIDTDGINDTHIDWGAGANQVDLADIPGGIAAGATVWNLGGSASFELPNGSDPDVAVVGQVSLDDNGGEEPNDVSLRTFEGSGTQYVLAKTLKQLVIPISNPDDLTGWTGRANTSQPVWFNKTGYTFMITNIYAISDADNYDFNLFESNSATDMSDENDTLIDLVECETDGTEGYTDTETTISHNTIEKDHAIIFEHSDGDAGGIIIVVSGWLNADVN